jgi:hypothetical protein
MTHQPQPQPQHATSKRDHTNPPQYIAEIDPQRPPRTRDELWSWIKNILDIDVARVPLTPGHSTPMDYLWHAFSEGGDTSDADPPQPIDCVVWANRGGGKTFMGALATALDLIFKPGIEVRILAGSVEQGHRMHAHLMRLFAREPLQDLVHGKMTERRIELTNGSVVELLAQSQASVRGTRVQKLRCDEVELFHSAVWEAAQLTTQSKRCGTFNVRGSVECMSTMHVPYGVMHNLVQEAAQGKRRLFKWGVLDVLAQCEQSRACETRGPAGAVRYCGLIEECAGRAKERPGNASGTVGGHLRIDDALRMKGRVSLNTWRTEMLCDRPRRSHCVLEEFDPAVHIFDDHHGFESAGCVWIGGMDFGFRAPTVVLWACIDMLGTLRVMHERCVAERTVREHAQAITHDSRPRLAWIGIDPAGNAQNQQTATTDREVLQKAGLTVRYRYHNIQAGLELIRARLRPADGGPPRLLIHRRCAELIAAMEKYHYPENDPMTLIPVKDGSDHAIDALRYMIVNLDSPGKTLVTNYVGT